MLLFTIHPLICKAALSAIPGGGAGCRVDDGQLLRAQEVLQALDIRQHSGVDPAQNTRGRSGHELLKGSCKRGNQD